MLVTKRNEKQASSDRELSRDWTDPAVQRAADELLIDHVELALTAARERWLLDLWMFLAVHGRAPSMRISGSKILDEREDLRRKRIETDAALAEFDAHPDGSICEDCARERGAVQHQNAVSWSGVCVHCGQCTMCTAITDWTWPYAGKSFTGVGTALKRLRKIMSEKHQQRERRLRALIGAAHA
jgi:hypothetical protein